MTEQEKKLQPQLQVDLQDAQGELAHLREKAFRMSDELNERFKTLHDSLSREPSVKDFSMHIDITDRLNPTLQLDIPAIIKMVDELKVARQKVHNLQERKTQLANGSGWRVAV
jgi:predicted DNA-binding ArsR family transcriptional regulator